MGLPTCVHSSTFRNQCVIWVTLGTFFPNRVYIAITSAGRAESGGTLTFFHSDSSFSLTSPSPFSSSATAIGYSTVVHVTLTKPSSNITVIGYRQSWFANLIPPGYAYMNLSQEQLQLSDNPELFSCIHF